VRPQPDQGLSDGRSLPELDWPEQVPAVLRRLDISWTTRILVALALVLLAHDSGGFGVSTWTGIAVAVSWCLVVAGALGAISPGVLGRNVSIPLVLLLVFGAFVGLSGLWASGADVPFSRADQAVLYAGTFALVAWTGRRLVSPFLDGIAAGLCVVALLALISRFFPSLIAEPTGNKLIAGASTRLSYPLGYWNALAALVALALPLLIRVAVDEARGAARALALAPVPALAAVVYLASSRTGAVTLLAGAAVFVACTPRRWPALGALVIAGAFGGVAALWLSREKTLTDGPLRTAQAASEGHVAALVVAATGLAAAALFAVAVPRLESIRVSRRAGRALLGAVVVVGLLAVVAAHPLRRWDNFTAKPASPGGPGYINNHFLSSNSSYRWQYWQATIDEFKTNPLVGRGSGSFEAWWDARGSVAGFVANPHSLYFETLGDLGLIGLVLLLGVFAAGIWAAARALPGAPDRLRDERGAALSAFVAFVVAAGLDWIWDFPVIGMVAFALLALALPPALVRTSRTRRGVRIAVAAVALVAVLVEGDLLLTTNAISASQSAATRGNLSAAASSARRATWLEPWAASPYVQLGLVQESQQRYKLALATMNTAIDRDPNDWRTWFLRYRIQRELGEVAVAVKSFARARALNPNSPLLNGG
jgi:O-antigen ligase